MSRRANTWVLLSAAIAIGCYALIFCELRPRVFWANPDFAGFYRAGRMVLAGDGRQVYDLASQRAYDHKLQASLLRPGQRMVTLPFLFAPYTLLLFAPIARLPYGAAEATWFALNVCAILAVPLLLRERFRLRTGIVIAALLLSPFFVPVTLAMMHGQTSLLLLFLLTVVVVSLGRGNDTVAGIALAFATFKPQLALAVLVALLAARKFKALSAFGTTSVALLASSIAQLGWRGVLGFPRAIVEFEHLPSNVFQEHPEFMPNLRGLATAALPGWPKAELAWLIAPVSALLLGIVAVLFARSSRHDYPLLFSILLTVTVLTSYHCYLHDASLLVLAGLLTVVHIDAQGWSTNRAALGTTMAAIFLLPIFLPFAAMAPLMASSLLLFTMLLSLELIQCAESPRAAGITSVPSSPALRGS